MEREREPEWVKLDDGQMIGVLQWAAVDGTVRRWCVCQGPRANNLRVRAKGREVITGWDGLLASLRRRLAVPRRQQR